jgi:protein-L-isoaspartate(D-aspartate) O-methyltransferase
MRSTGPSNSSSPSMPTDRLTDLRAAFAAQLARDSSIEDPRLIDAFATIPRENFLGAGPWHVLQEDGYAVTPGNDPALVYANSCIALDPARRINNGEPGLHMGLIAQLAPRPGDHVVQIGVGGGYYTAILAHLVRPRGRITAIEYDSEIAHLGAANLAAVPDVEVICADGTIHDFDPADGIYVNAGASKPLALWLDKLKPAGRLIMMLTTDDWWGRVLKVTRLDVGFAAAVLGPCGFIPCVNGRDLASAMLLAAALRRGGDETVRSLRRDVHAADDTCWLHGDGICLSRRPLH